MTLCICYFLMRVFSSFSFLKIIFQCTWERYSFMQNVWYLGIKNFLEIFPQLHLWSCDKVHVNFCLFYLQKIIEQLIFIFVNITENYPNHLNQLLIQILKYNIFICVMCVKYSNITFTFFQGFGLTIRMLQVFFLDFYFLKYFMTHSEPKYIFQKNLNFFFVQEKLKRYLVLRLGEFLAFTTSTSKLIL